MFAVGALVAAVVTIGIDDQLAFKPGRDRFLVGDTDTALTLTSVVATGMLAFLGIVFATTLVSIQLAASQYSPRAVRVFIRSRLTKVSLGIFVAVEVDLDGVTGVVDVRPRAGRVTQVLCDVRRRRRRRDRSSSCFWNGHRASVSVPYPLGIAGPVARAR